MKISDFLDLLDGIFDLWKSRWRRLVSGVIFAVLVVLAIHHQYGDRPRALFVSVPSAIILAGLGIIWQIGADK